MHHKRFGSLVFKLRRNYTTVAASIAICCVVGGLGLTAAETKIEGQADDLQIHAVDAHRSGKSSMHYQPASI